MHATTIHQLCQNPHIWYDWVSFALQSSICTDSRCQTIPIPTKEAWRSCSHILEHERNLQNIIRRVACMHCSVSNYSHACIDLFRITRLQLRASRRECENGKCRFLQCSHKSEILFGRILISFPWFKIIEIRNSQYSNSGNGNLEPPRVLGSAIHDWLCLSDFGEHCYICRFPADRFINLSRTTTRS